MDPKYQNLFTISALLLAAVVRIFPVWNADFPLNDGGLFYTMAQDLINNNFQLPAFTSYNHLQIPFAYPPLGIYLLATLHHFFNLNLPDLVRWLPVIFSIITIPAFFLFARSFFANRHTAILSTLIFSSIPKSFEWQIMGGGITRSLGMWFAVLSLWGIYNLFSNFSRRHLLAAISFSTLTVLSHPEAAWFVIYSSALFFLTSKSQSLNFKSSLLVALAVTSLTSPWWGLVISRHDLSPFLSAFHTGTQFLTGLYMLLSFDLKLEPLTAIFTTLGILGIFVQIHKRQWLLPLWITIIFLLDPRSAARFITIPLALTGSIFLTTIFLPALNRTKLKFLIWLLAYSFISAISLPWNDHATLVSLSTSDRLAMTWINHNTSPDSRWLVLPSSPSGHWSVDRITEWFPALTDRHSLTTVQGTEWLPSAYYSRIQNYLQLKNCNSQTHDCLQNWSQQTGRKFTHIYIPQTTPPCCALLEHSLRHSSSYRLIYDEPGAAIFAL